MANKNAPMGFVPWGPILRVNNYYVSSASAAITIGSPVVQTAAGYVNSCAATGSDNLNIRGVSLSYLAASGSGWISVSDHPDQLYVCQYDIVAGQTYAETANNSNINYSIGTAHATIYSGTYLDHTDLGTAAADVRIIKLAPIAGNSVGDFAKVLCKFNAHSLAGSNDVGL